MFTFRKARRSKSALPIFQWKKDVDPVVLVAFLFGWGGLLKTYRQGWYDRGAIRQEWVFDHQNFLKVCVRNFGQYLKEPGFNVARAATIAGNHENGELYGDHTPHEGLNPTGARLRRDFFRQPLPDRTGDVQTANKENKEQEEAAAMSYLTGLMHPYLGVKYLRAWQEYTQGESREAIFVRQMHTIIDCVRATLNKAETPRDEYRTFFDDAYNHPTKKVRDPLLLVVVKLIEVRYDQIEESFKNQKPRS